MINYLIVLLVIFVMFEENDYLRHKTKQIKVKELEDQIDEMVYTLYGLTDEEIEIVEGSND